MCGEIKIQNYVVWIQILLLIHSPFITRIGIFFPILNHTFIVGDTAILIFLRLSSWRISLHPSLSMYPHDPLQIFPITWTFSTANRKSEYPRFKTHNPMHHHFLYLYSLHLYMTSYQLPFLPVLTSFSKKYILVSTGKYPLQFISKCLNYLAKSICTDNHKLNSNSYS